MKKIAILLCLLTLCFSLFGCGVKFSGDCKYIAHRGYSSKAADNTAEAFRLAAESEHFWGIETDIHYTSDKKFICVHDEAPFYKNETSVQSLTYDKAMHTAINKHGDLPCDFDTYLDICKASGKIAVIEIKFTYESEMLFAAITQTLAKLNPKEFIVISFQEGVISTMKEYYPSITTQWLISDEANLSKCLTMGYTPSLNYDLISEERVRAFHDKGIEVGAWTVNKGADEKAMIKLGVDYITTNG